MLQSVLIYCFVIASMTLFAIDYNRRYSILGIRINKINFKDPEI